MKEFTPEYLEHLRKIIHDRADAAAAEELADLHPADIAELYKDLDLDEAEYLFKLLDEDMQADVLMELDEDDRAKLLSKTSFRNSMPTSVRKSSAISTMWSRRATSSTFSNMTRTLPAA